MSRNTYSLTLETVNTSRTIFIIGFRAALDAARALAGTGNGCVFIRRAGARPDGTGSYPCRYVGGAA